MGPASNRAPSNAPPGGEGGSSSGGGGGGGGNTSSSPPSAAAPLMPAPSYPPAPKAVEEGGWGAEDAAWEEDLLNDLQEQEGKEGEGW